MITPPAKKGRATRQSSDEVVVDGSGRPLFRIRRHRDSVSFVFRGSIVGQKLDVLSDALARVLQKEQT